MSPAAAVSAQLAKPDSRPWVIVAALFAIQVVNFADKAVLSIAATAIMRDLQISPTRYGLLASSFFSLYALTGLFVGLFVAPRVRPRWILVVLVAIWSLSQLPILWTSSFATLLVCRIILGAGEGAGTPTSLNTSHEWFAPEARTMPTAIILSGAAVGSLLAAPTLSYVVEAFGWRAAFGLCSALGFAVLVGWLLVARDGPYSGIVGVGEKPAALSGTWRLLRDPAVVGCVLVGFCYYWITGYTVAWLAPMLTLHMGFDRISTGWILAAIFLFQTITVLGISALSERHLRRGGSSRSARGVLNAVCLLGGAVCFTCAAVIQQPMISIGLLTLAVSLPTVGAALTPALLAEIAPSKQRNALITVVLSLITVAGILSPALTGYLVEDGASGWSNTLLVNAAICLVGALSAYALLHPERAVARLRPSGGQT